MSRRAGFLLIMLPTALVLLAVLTTGAALELENRDAFCASCHTEPEATFYQRTLEAPSDLASAHSAVGVRCIDCHSGEGLAGRIDALLQGASDLGAYLSGSYTQPAVTTNPVGEIGCTQCHAPPSRDDPPDEDALLPISASHYHLVEYADAWMAMLDDAVGTCARCHVAHTENTLEALLWRPMPVVNAACSACHQVLSGQTP